MDAASPRAPPPVTDAALAARAKIDKTAKDFEASFLSIMFGQMFAGVGTGGAFGGGHGEAMFRSMLTDAMAQQTVRSGGVGVSTSVAREMLKLQGLN